LDSERVENIDVENFHGADTISAVICWVMKRAVSLALILSGVLLFAQPTIGADGFDPIFGFYRPELFTTIDSIDLVRDLSMREFLNARLPGSTRLGQMGAVRVANFPMTLASAQLPPAKKGTDVSGPVQDPKDGKEYSSVESMALEKASLVWTGGEIGFFYGHSASGKFSGDEFGSYLMGGVGNEHLQINVGAGYEESHYSRSRH
jgi:hypothetical protein